MRNYARTERRIREAKKYLTRLDRYLRRFEKTDLFKAALPDFETWEAELHVEVAREKLDGLLFRLRTMREKENNINKTKGKERQL
ncbi:MAG: hypothetical protein LUI09_03720 [Prevotellaceae bacterium]|nr:hypothetical protein [Prevotellaceae bacterium]